VHSFRGIHTSGSSHIAEGTRGEAKECPVCQLAMCTLVLRKMGSHIDVAKVMVQPVVTFEQTETARKLIDTLSNYEHNGFPVLGASGCFVGMVIACSPT
jgi:CBS-domain-containing membrane protein